MTYDYKQDFPIFQHTNVAYIDNAATAQRPQCVIALDHSLLLQVALVRVFIEFVHRLRGNPSGESTVPRVISSLPMMGASRSSALKDFFGFSFGSPDSLASAC